MSRLVSAHYSVANPGFARPSIARCRVAVHAEATQELGGRRGAANPRKLSARDSSLRHKPAPLWFWRDLSSRRPSLLDGSRKVEATQEQAGRGPQPLQFFSGVSAFGYAGHGCAWCSQACHGSPCLSRASLVCATPGISSQLKGPAASRQSPQISTPHRASLRTSEPGIATPVLARLRLSGRGRARQLKERAGGQPQCPQTFQAGQGASRLLPARFDWSRHCVARPFDTSRGKDRSAGTYKPAAFLARRGWAGRRGARQRQSSRRGAWFGNSRQGIGRRGTVIRAVFRSTAALVCAKHGIAGYGVAGHGAAWLAWAWRGQVGHGTAVQSKGFVGRPKSPQIFWQRASGLVGVGHGRAAQGLARQLKDARRERSISPDFLASRDCAWQRRAGPGMAGRRRARHGKETARWEPNNPTRFSARLRSSGYGGASLLTATQGKP